MITKRLNTVDTEGKVFCGNCEQEAAECTICGRCFDDSTFIRCVCLQVMHKGKEYLEFMHLCHECKDKKHEDEE